MNTLPGISLYNQDRLSDENFVANFTVRLGQLGELLNGLRSQSRGAPPRHEIVVGARGMGKTSLLRRISIAVASEDELRSHFIPMRFREEQYNVISLDTFWRNCCEVLAEWCDENGRPELASSLDVIVAAAAGRDDDKAEAAFLDACQALGRRAVLLLDNLDLILGGLKVNDAWRLRRVLQSKDGPIVIGAATQLLAQGGDREAPFYEFFYPIILEPLTEAELLSCMRALALMRQDAGKPVLAIINREPERLRTLFALTGGNPRVLVLIYQLLERAESDTIFADLEALLDQVTPLYKARVEEYQGVNQRALIDAVALNWDPITSHALVDATGIEITTISSLLNRLKKDGFIDEVERSGTRAGYQIAERFLNIWYLMRHGTRRTRQRLRWLTLFLTKLFSAADLEKMAGEARAMAGKWHPYWCEAVSEAYGEKLREVMLLPSGEFYRLETESSPEIKHRISLKDKTESRVDQNFPLSDAAEIMENWQNLLDLGHHNQIIAVYDTLLRRLRYVASQEAQVQIATALFSKAATLGQFGRNEEAIAVYDELVAHLADVAIPDAQERIARALVNKGVALGRFGRSEQEISIYDGLVARFADVAIPDVQEQIAKALFNKGITLGRLGRNEEAIAVYDGLMARFTDVAIPDVQEQIVRALSNKGVALGRLGRSEEEISVYDGLVARFADVAVPGVQEQIARALVNKGFTLGQLGRGEEAISVYDGLVARFADVAIPDVHEQIAKALFNKGVTLGRLGRSEEAIAVYDGLVARFSGVTTPDMQEQIARALVNKGFTLGQLGRSEEAIAVYDGLVARFANVTIPDVQKQIAGALINKGIALGQLGRSEETIAVYDGLVARFADVTVPGMQKQIAGALANKGRALADSMEAYEEAEASYRKALELAPGERMTIANLAWLQLAMGRLGEASASIEQLEALEPVGLLLLKAGQEIVHDNFGNAVTFLGKALASQLEDGVSPFFEDLLRLLRISASRGFGERLLGWFEESGNAERYAPVHGAFIAYLRGERFLLDINPETRVAASKLYRFLAGSHRKADGPAPRKRSKAAGAKSRRTRH